MKIIGSQWKITERLKDLSSINANERWQITYSTPTYGGWDLIVECNFTNLEDLNKIVTFCRTDPELSQWIEATTTLISVKKNYPF